MRNIMSDLKETLGTRSPSMDDAFRDAFPIKLRKFLDEMVILQQYWS